MKKELTKKQNDIFMYIRNCIEQTGFPPTVREIGNHFNITVKGAYDHLKAIEKKGYVKCIPGKSRAIEIVYDKLDSSKTKKIPIVGTIAAGMPILAEENIEGMIELPPDLVCNGNLFALKIKGDSMIESGINDGDIAIIKQQHNAENGQIVAALIENEATLKILKKEKDKIILKPANKNYKPIILKQVSILGVLVALYRKYF